MTNRTIIASTAAAASFLLGVACDKPDQKAEDPPAAADVELEGAAENRVDLEAVVDVVAQGQVATAAELEAKLESDAIARVDIDADGTADKLKIVERRTEKATVFEIRALPSSKAEVTVETAPQVAELELEAKADVGDIVARASYSASFVASATAKVEASTKVEHTFSAVASVSAEGTMNVDASANVFLSWAFKPARPVYVAQVFVIAEADTPQEDPCWPPGHCKHGLWKATGELPPGQQKRADASFAKKEDHATAGKSNAKGASAHDDDHGKAKGGDHGKAAKSDPPSSKSGGAGKPNASKSDGDKGGKGGAGPKDSGGKGKGK